MGDRSIAEVERGVSGYTLKIVAVISMFIDHFAATIFYRSLMLANQGELSFVSEHWDTFYSIYIVMRGIGRVAFPIYCFLIVQGFLHTKSVANYAKRLFLFALISEIPFDLAFQKRFWDIGYNNVFWTLLFGLLAIAGISEINKRIVCLREDGTLNYSILLLRSMANMFVIFVCMFMAEVVLKTDYGAAGIIAILLLYLLRNHPKTAFFVTVIMLTVLVGEREIVALAGLPLLAYYNGMRGRQLKYFFYAFYPAHLLLLSCICMVIGLG